MALTAKLSIAPGSDPRGHSRRSVRLTIGSEAGSGLQPAMVHDISRTGLLLETGVEIEAGETIVVHLLAETQTAIVIWRSGRFHGCSFQVPLSTGAVSALALSSAFAGTASDDRPRALPTARKVQVILLLGVALWGLLTGTALWLVA